MWCPKSKKVIQSKDVTFNETVMLSSVKNPVISSTSACNQEDASRSMEIEVETVVAQGGATNQPNRDVQVIEPVTISSDQSQVEVDYSIAHDHPCREIKRLARYNDDEGLIVQTLSIVEEIPKGVEPLTYSEAISCPSLPNGVITMQEKMESLDKHRTWELCKPPKGRRALTAKWIYERKEGIPGVEDARWKACLVVRGCNQKEGIDYSEVFSPVVRYSSIRVLITFVVLFDLNLEQLDVKTAFLHRELGEEIYMEQSEGFLVLGKEQQVCKLKKFLYELKQAPGQ